MEGDPHWRELGRDRAVVDQSGSSRHVVCEVVHPRLLVTDPPERVTTDARDHVSLSQDLTERPLNRQRNIVTPNGQFGEQPDCRGRRSDVMTDATNGQLVARIASRVRFVITLCADGRASRVTLGEAQLTGSRRPQ
jgi:hypothetical protein